MTRLQALDTDRYGELFRHLLDRGSTSRRASTSACSPRSPTATRRSTRRSRRSASCSGDGAADDGAAETIAAEARRESPLWAAALRAEPDWEPIFSPLAPERFALGLETIYEAYLVHYGALAALRLAGDESERVLLGDYLYAHGLVRIAEAGGVDAVAAMAELISRCAALRAAGETGDGDAWIDAARALGGEPGRRTRSRDGARAALALESRT